MGPTLGGRGAILYFETADVHVTRQAFAGKGVEFEHDSHVLVTDAGGPFGPAGEDEWMTS